MTIRTYRQILRNNDRYCAHYCITNSQHRLTDSIFSGDDDNSSNSLLLQPLKHIEKSRYVDFVRQLQIESLGRCDEYLDEGLFRINFINLLLGLNAGGWMIARIDVKYAQLCFHLHNPSFNLWAGSEDVKFLQEFREQAIADCGYEENRMIAKLSTPISSVLVYWNPPKLDPCELAEDRKPLCQTVIEFDVLAPKRSGKYPKHRRATLRVASDGYIRVIESSKHCRREIGFLESTSEQKAEQEQPVEIVEYYK